MSRPHIQLFEFGPTRSIRCRWMLVKAGLAFESIDRGPGAIGSPELAAIHPLGKLPAAVIGRSLGWLVDALNAYLDRLIARPACPIEP